MGLDAAVHGLAVRVVTALPVLADWGARRCSLNEPASTEGKKSWPSHGYNKANDPMVETKNRMRNTVLCAMASCSKRK